MILKNKFKYEFSKKQLKKFKKWKKKLPEINEGVSGGRYTIEFTPTGIATAIVIKTSDGYKLDLTDYEAW